MTGAREDFFDNTELAIKVRKIFNIDITKYMYLCDDVVISGHKLYDFLGIERVDEAFLVARIKYGGVDVRQSRLVCKYDDEHIYGEKGGVVRYVDKKGLLEKRELTDTTKDKYGYYDYQVMKNFASLKFLKICKEKKYLEKLKFRDSKECESMYSEEVYMSTQRESQVSDIVFKMSSTVNELNQFLMRHDGVDMLGGSEEL